MAPREFLFTSESVTEGHPHKVADQISDSVLDAGIGRDENGCVACETLITTGLVMLARKLCKRLAEARKVGELPYLRPDGKAQVTVRYAVGDEGRQTAVEIERILVSTQHADGRDAESLIKPDLIERVLHPILPPDLYDEKRFQERDFVYVNPTGKFVIGGPMGDTGLTGRKIIVDTYGVAARHGGGAFSGKDPTKVDRSAAYAARYVAKNIVAAGLADRCEVNVAY